MSGARVGVVGAGIVGVACAFELATRGYRVTLFDQDDPGRFGPSYGNAGHVVGSDIFPLGVPGIEWVAARMLVDRYGALKMPPYHLPTLLPWLWRFWSTSYGSANERSIRALTELSSDTLDDTESLFQRANMTAKLKRVPALFLYESDRTYARNKPGWGRKEAAGRTSLYVSETEVRELEPELAPVFKHGVLSHDYGVVSDPYDVVCDLFEAACKLGVDFQRARVDRIAPSDKGPLLVSDANSDGFDATLITAGVWSRALANDLGDRLPLEAERGYNLTYPDQGAIINRPVVFADRGVVATSLTSGLRLGGWAELGGTKRPPRATYYDRMRRIADTLIPGLKGANASEWMGHRPALPDSVPVLSRSTRDARVFYATGHGHYGLSYAARSAQMMADLIAGKAADSEFEAFSIRRFV